MFLQFPICVFCVFCVFCLFAVFRKPVCHCLACALRVEMRSALLADRKSLPGFLNCVSRSDRLLWLTAMRLVLRNAVGLTVNHYQCARSIQCVSRIGRLLWRTAGRGGEPGKPHVKGCWQPCVLKRNLITKRALFGFGATNWALGGQERGPRRHQNEQL